MIGVAGVQMDRPGAKADWPGAKADWPGAKEFLRFNIFMILPILALAVDCPVV